MARILASIDLELDVTRTCDAQLTPAMIAQALNRLFVEIWPPKFEGDLTEKKLVTAGPPKRDFAIRTLQARSRVLAHGLTPPPEPAAGEPAPEAETDSRSVPPASLRLLPP